MTAHPTSSTAFPRSTRALHADSLVPGLAILIILMVLLLGWLLWLLLFQIPFYATSQSARVTPEALVVADFPADVLSQIRPGQEALFVPAARGNPAAQGRALTASVVEIDTVQRKVWLLFTADPEAQRQLAPGLRGEARVVVEKRSPLSLILEAVGMDLSTTATNETGMQPALLQ